MKARKHASVYLVISSVVYTGSNSGRNCSKVKVKRLIDYTTHKNFRKLLNVLVRRWIEGFKGHFHLHIVSLVFSSTIGLIVFFLFLSVLLVASLFLTSVKSIHLLTIYTFTRCWYGKDTSVNTFNKTSLAVSLVSVNMN